MVRHQKGHKNSNGELAEWVIVSHKDGHIISSHKTKAEAEKHLGDIRKFKHMGESMQLEEAKELLESEGYLLEDKSASDYKTFKGYLKDFKAELLTQYMSPEIGERKYKDIIVNKTLFKFIKDNWANGDYSPAEMVEYILDNDLDESYQIEEDFTQGVRCTFGCRPRYSTFNAMLCSSYDAFG